MSEELRSEYQDFIIRKRWMLMRAIPILHGVFNYTIRKFSPAPINELSEIEQEKFRKLVVKGKVSKETEELMTYSSWHDESKYFMIGEDFSEIIIPIDDDNFEESEEYRLISAINETRERFKATSDLKKCELPYVTDNGNRVPYHGLSEWNADYILEWGKSEGLDVDLLIEIRGHSDKPVPDYSGKPWKCKKPERERSYDFPLMRILEAYCEVRRSVPTAAEILRDWKNKTPPGIVGVTSDSFVVLTKAGREEEVSLRSLNEAIQRRIEFCDHW